MKPKHLIMKAFGPYHKQAEINFDSLGNGLTLITGSTGAGKTSIFDAICCSLYGETSGNARKFSEMRNENAQDDEITQLDFTFELRGNQYRVVRSPKYVRAKKGGGDTSVPAKAELTLQDGSVLTGPEKVNERLRLLLGIEKEEFRQIVMIAQNDFMAMIKDTNKSQEDTFNKIFDAQLYRKFDDKIAQIKKESQRSFENICGELKAALRPLSEQPGMSALIEQPEPPISSVLALLEATAQRLLEEKGKAEEQSKIARLKKEEKLAELGTATEISKKFEQLTQTEKGLRTLDTQAATINELRAELCAAERVRDGLLAPFKALQDAQTTYKTLTTTAVKLAAHQKTLSEQLEQAAALLTEERNKQPERDERKQKKRMLEKEIPQYDTLAELAAKKEAAQAALASQNKNLAALTENLQQDRQKLAGMTVLADDYYNNQITRLKAETKQAEEDSKFVRSLVQRIKNQFEDAQTLKTKRADTKQADVTLAALSTQFQTASKQFFSEQAGFLASSLTPGAPCPVCGSLEHPAPAVYSKHAVSKNEVDRLEALVAEKRKMKMECLQSANQFWGTLSAQAQALCREQTEVAALQNKCGLDVQTQAFDDWKEALENFWNSKAEWDEPNLKTLHKVRTALDRLLKEIHTRVVESGKTLRSQRDEAENKKKQNAQAECDKKALEQGIAQNEKELAAGRETIVRLEGEAANLAQQAGLIASGLSCADQQEAHRQIDVLDHAIVQAEQRLNRAQERFETINKEAADTQGRIKLTHEQLVQNEQRTGAAKLAFDQALADNDFADTQAFLDAKRSPSRMSTIAQEIKNYESKRQQAQADKARLLNETQGTALPNLAALTQALNTAREHEEKAQAVLTACTGAEMRAQEALTQVNTLATPLRKAAQRRNLYYDLDKSVNSRGATFAQYVLSTYFERVLAKANLRLERMTDGRYALSQPEAGKLGIDVFDAYAGGLRPLKTLSGGETFMASLALALGFSEVVQEQNGGVRLDTIFIDEGFGSLDPEYLDKAVNVLTELSEDRNVAIISHVEELNRRIPQKILVEKTRTDSHIRVITQRSC